MELDSINIIKLIQKIKPDGYNLGAQVVWLASLKLLNTANSDGIGTLRILEAIKH